MKRHWYLVFSLSILLLLAVRVHAQLSAAGSPGRLALRQQHIVTISSLTAKGDLVPLHKAFADALEAGLTISEIRELLVHLYAYTGFPRSLQGINTFIAVLDSRKANGIIDSPGPGPGPIENNVSKYQQGKIALEKLTGVPEREPKTGYAAFAPVIDTFLKEHLFADIFNRDVLSYADREIATVSALTSLGGVEPMMRSHMEISLRLGIIEPQLRHLLALIEEKVGPEEAEAGRRVLSAITNHAAAQDSVGTAGKTKNLFARGLKASATNFTGTVWVNMVMSPQAGMGVSIGTVTFEPGARSNWHKHPGGQILLVTEGKGWYQERGQPRKIMQKGDVVQCLPGIEHWHGALPGSKVAHIAIGPNAQKGSVAWLQRVTDQDYKGGNQ